MSRQFLVFVEGGNNGTLNTRCRQGFGLFFEKAGLKGKMPRIIACGNRWHAYEDFCTALAQAKPGDFIVLLIDSEGPVSVTEDRVWDHLRNQEGDKWTQPPAASPDQLHFMVECMEAWFLADTACLAAYYGQGFKIDKLPRTPDIEKIPKSRIYEGLKRATENCKTRAVYGKGTHSFDLIGKIDPTKVTAASRYAARLIAKLLEKEKKS